MTWLHQPRIIICDHPTDGYVCGQCVEEFEWCLGDIPALEEDLEIALVKDVRFPAHGIRQDQTKDADEAPLPFNQAASSCLAELKKATIHPPGDWTAAKASRWMLTNLRMLLLNPGIGDTIAAVSAAAARAHRIIDRPPHQSYFGQCFGESCNLELWADRDAERVSCQCGYTASLGEHRDRIVSEHDQNVLTVDELAFVLARTGQAVTKDRIKYVVKTRGVPRDRINKPRWVNGRITATEVDVFKLRDVLDALDEGDLRNRPTCAIVT